MAKSSPLEFGRIVWAEVADAKGIRKSRPAVVVTNNDKIAPGSSWIWWRSRAACPNHCLTTTCCYLGIHKGIRAPVSIESAWPSVAGCAESCQRILRTSRALSRGKRSWKSSPRQRGCKTQSTQNRRRMYRKGVENGETHLQIRPPAGGRRPSGARRRLGAHAPRQQRWFQLHRAQRRLVAGQPANRCRRLAAEL